MENIIVVIVYLIQAVKALDNVEFTDIMDSVRVML